MESLMENFFRFTFGYLILQQDTQIKAMTEMAKTSEKMLCCPSGSAPECLHKGLLPCRWKW